jgi:formate-dependent nitrite reductase membrane component NrfD
VAAVLAGAATLTIVGVAVGADSGMLASIIIALGTALVLHAVLVFAELGVTHVNVDVRLAAGLLTRGPWKARFWGGAVGGGIVVPLVLLLATSQAWPLAAALALGGLWLYEDLWVKAGQSVPLS